jgi:hypothetical protein
VPRPIKISRFHDEFEARIDELLAWEASLDGMAEAAPANKVWHRRRLCEAVLVLACSHWERFVENLFATNLAKDISRLGQTAELRDLEGGVSLSLAHALMTGEDRYFDIRGYDELLGRAKRSLAGHRFDQVAKPERRVLDTIQALRNHVLHRSRRSKRKLRTYLPRLHDVGFHLSSRMGGTRRLRSYLLVLKDASAKMR